MHILLDLIVEKNRSGKSLIDKINMTKRSLKRTKK